MNIYDIAKEANVSISTVSRVMNNSGAVSEKTRRKVEAIIEKQGFTPNMPAKYLASNRTNLIGILVPDVRNYFHAQAVYEIDSLLRGHGYTTFLTNTSEDTLEKLRTLKMQLNQKVDGIITVGSSYSEDEFIEELVNINKEVPVVQLNNYNEQTVCVYCDEKDGMRQSLAYLNLNGYKNPIFISETLDKNNRAYSQKRNGFKEYLETYYPSNEFVELNTEKKEGSIREITKFLIKHPEVDAIQCENDSLSIKIYKTLKDMGIFIPAQIGIIGFDNSEATNYTQQKISSIDHKIKEHSQLSVNLLLKMLNDEDVKFKNIIKPKLIIKETT